VASALSAAHAQGFFHGTIKPNQVLVENDPPSARAYLTDLWEHQLTLEGFSNRLGGTASAPTARPREQIEGSRLDARTDVYALGCVLYETLSGEVPYPRDGYVHSTGTKIRFARRVDFAYDLDYKVGDEIPSPEAFSSLAHDSDGLVYGPSVDWLWGRRGTGGEHGADGDGAAAGRGAH